MKIQPEHIELDKIPNAWVLTYWLGGGNPHAPVLRLKITHTSFEEPNEVEAEVRFGPSGPFIRVHRFDIAAYSAAHPEEDPEAWDDLPGVFTNEFKEMLRVWGALSEVMSLGATVATRYANEPADSRDWYSLGLDDRTCENDPRH